jgi:hypothetical protein
MSRVKSVKKWHGLFLWPALIATLIYILSALSHPLMVWTGPQAKKMFPPALVLEGQEVENISKIIQENNLDKALIAKFVPFKDQVLFQVTQDSNSPRRYFSSINFSEVLDHDRQQAIWLAQHYLGAEINIRSIEFQSQFDEQYPAVNRLLPVYKISYDTQDNLSVFVHTETQALAGITNDWKRSLRWLFQNLHSFEFLSDFESIRLALVILMVSLITLMAVTGLMFLVVLKRRSKAVQIERRWHSRLAYVVVVPLILFSISGIYHLLYSSFENGEVENLYAADELPLANWSPITLPNSLIGTQINQISLVKKVENDECQFLYRVSSAVDNPLQDNSRAKRFKGASAEFRGSYIDSQSGSLLEQLDNQLVIQKAQKIFQENGEEATNSQQISHFSPSYDFRNKRLPVWQVNSSDGMQVFIDPVSGQLIDYNNTLDRVEGYSFSFLHKWNLLVPLVGRFYRDVSIVVVLSLALLLSLLGLVIHLKNRKKVLIAGTVKDAVMTP